MTRQAAMRIGTRGSRLALIQAEMAARALAVAGLDGDIEIVTVRTRGDELSRSQPRGDWQLVDGQFTSELERALLADEIDIAVHSYKDLPTVTDPRLAIGAALERDDPRDCLLTRDGLLGTGRHGLAGLRARATIATSSPRRSAQLLAARPGVTTTPVRGNVETRIARLRQGEFDGLLLAAAGLHRLGIEIAPDAYLPFEVMLPAPAQAALALQVRGDDKKLRERLTVVEHRPTRIAVDAERALLRRIGGGCLAPLGALGAVEAERLRLRAAFDDGSGSFRRADVSGASAAPDEVVEMGARRLLEAVA